MCKLSLIKPHHYHALSDIFFFKYKNSAIKSHDFKTPKINKQIFVIEHNIFIFYTTFSCFHLASAWYNMLIEMVAVVVISENGSINQTKNIIKVLLGAFVAEK